MTSLLNKITDQEELDMIRKMKQVLYNDNTSGKPGELRDSNVKNLLESLINVERDESDDELVSERNYKTDPFLPYGVGIVNYFIL